MDKIVYINQIVEKIKSIHPYKIILFGSYAYGIPDTESDIDIIVVTNDEFYPKNYDERLEVYLKISTLIYEFKRKTSIDLIVYTKPMYQKFIEAGSIFSKEINLRGKILYENVH